MKSSPEEYISVPSRSIVHAAARSTSSMQSWPSQGQNGADGHGSWHSGFAYPSPNGHFDPGQQQWSQAAFAPAGHDPPEASVPDFHFVDPEPQDAGAFLGDQHLTSLQPGQTGFHGASGALALGQQQFHPAGHDLLDPAFGVHPDLFGPQQQQPQQPKGNLASAAPAGLGQMAMGGQGQSHPHHPHAHPQAFARHDYAFTPQGFNAPQVSQYTSAQLMPRPSPSPSRQQSHTPVQQHFDGGDNLHGHFPQGQPFAQSPQQPQQHQQQQYLAQKFAPPPGNGQPIPYQAGPHSHLVYHQFQEPPQAHLQQARFQQAGFAPRQPLAYQQPGAGLVGQGPPGQQALQPAGEADAGTLAPAESPAKRRKRATRSASDVSAVEPLAPVVVDLTDSAGKRADDTDALQAPVPSAEEALLIAESAKRGKAAQSKVPSAKALPFLVYHGSVRLPAPKSYDKLVPLVAVPSRSGKPPVPGIGYALPCEIQGRFTSQYRPSPDKAGLDERRAEAKHLLDDYDHSMKALRRRQPKYTEYPHAFKEQLKADEASKNKAEKKAKRELEDGRNKPVRSATRPADAVAAVEWDVIGIVHIDQSVGRTTALIAGRVQQAGEFLIKLRGEATRAKQALDQAAKDKRPEADVATLWREAEQKKEMLYRALDATVEHADDSVLDNLGGHQKLVLSLVNTLISSIKAGDFSGKLPKIVLELFTHLSLTKKVIETTNFETVRKRLEDKGDDEVKDLVRELSSKIKKLSRSSEPETTTGYTGTSAASRAKAGIKPAAAESAAKRGRDDDSDTATRTVKKIAVEPGSSSLSKKLAQPKSQPASASKAAAAAPKPSTILPGKSRPVAKPAPKPAAEPPPTAADSPSASADEKGPRKPARADAKAPAAKKEAKAAATASSGLSAVSSISSLLESINAKKPEPAAAGGPKEGKRSATPETAEEKAKRFRKEARRKLRVSWKPEGELVQMRVFEKDEEEDEGRDVNMLRDAADDRSEGMVLKRRANVALDDEDDDAPYGPWSAPAATDFSGLPDRIRDKNFVTHGGRVAFTTEEQKLMAEREQRELMVIYTDPADIPPSPKSPPPEPSVPGLNVKLGQFPKDDARVKEIQLCWRDTDQMGLEQALHAAMKRLESRDSLSTRLDSILGRLNQSGPGASPAGAQKLPSSPHAAAAAAAANSNVPLAVSPAVETYVLAWLRWDRIKSWRDPSPAQTDASRVHEYANPEAQAAGAAVEAAATSLAGKTYPAVSPPDWLARDEERVREWWLGYNKESAARQRREEEGRARAEAEAKALRAGQGAGNAQDWGAYYAQQQQQQQQQAYAPYMALLQQVNGQDGATQGKAQIPDSQLQSILAAINQPSQQRGGGGAYDSPSAQGQPGPAYGERDRERGEGQHGREHHREAKEGRKKKASLPPHKPANKALIGTKPCTFWQQGKCARGDKCTFRHD